VKDSVSIVFALIVACCALASGQEMEPRSYSRAPVGTQFVLLTFVHQSGDVFTDSSLPLRDVKVKLNSGWADVRYLRQAGEREFFGSLY